MTLITVLLSTIRVAARIPVPHPPGRICCYKFQLFVYKSTHFLCILTEPIIREKLVYSLMYISLYISEFLLFTLITLQILEF